MHTLPIELNPIAGVNSKIRTISSGSTLPIYAVGYGYLASRKLKKELLVISHSPAPCNLQAVIVQSPNPLRGVALQIPRAFSFVFGNDAGPFCGLELRPKDQGPIWAANELCLTCGSGGSSAHRAKVGTDLLDYWREKAIGYSPLLKPCKLCSAVHKEELLKNHTSTFAHFASKVGIQNENSYSSLTKWLSAKFIHAEADILKATLDASVFAVWLDEWLTSFSMPALRHNYESLTIGTRSDLTFNDFLTSLETLPLSRVVENAKARARAIRAGREISKKNV